MISRPRAPGRLPELLVPAGRPDKLEVAIRYGADAVYLAGKRFGLRAGAGNFGEADLARAVDLARRAGVRIYVTLNIFAHDQDLEGLDSFLDQLVACGVDGVIVADPGVLRRVRRQAPDLAVHISTQANVTNSETALFWQDQGAVRINLARELGLEEIRRIRQACDVEIEVFVHGALCISYSGRCMLSAYLTGRDANRGDCAQPCRYAYRLVEEKRPGQYFPVEEDGRGTYIFNSRDLCLLSRLDELRAAGVDAVKIEGRMKSVYYLAVVTRAYRAMLDCLARGKGPDPGLEERLLAELRGLSARGLTENFFHGPPGREGMSHQRTRLPQALPPAALVLGRTGEDVGDNEALRLDVRGAFGRGEFLDYLAPDLNDRRFQVRKLWDLEGAARNRVHPGQQVRVLLHPAEPLPAGGLLRLAPVQEG